MQKINLLGQVFGKITVIDSAPNGPRGTMWKCKCECGVIKNIHTTDLRWSTVTSCGCVRDQLRHDKKKHGMCKTSLYKTWSCMKQRCTNPNYNEYCLYGGRGIKFCIEWSNFMNFKYWALNNGYQIGLSIDRIDVNGNYEPSNCKWSNAYEQANNKRNNVKYEYKGETKTRSEWARVLNINYFKLRNRIDRYGWSVEKAFTTK